MEKIQVADLNFGIVAFFMENWILFPELYGYKGKNGTFLYTRDEFVNFNM